MGERENALVAAIIEWQSGKTKVSSGELDLKAIVKILSNKFWIWQLVARRQRKVALQPSGGNSGRPSRQATPKWRARATRTARKDIVFFLFIFFSFPFGCTFDQGSNRGNLMMILNQRRL